MRSRIAAVVTAVLVVLLLPPAVAGAAIRASDLDVPEGNSVAVVKLAFRDDAASLPATWRCVDYRTVDGKASSVVSAALGAGGPGWPDYEAVTGTACLPPGESEGTIDLTIRGDVYAEFDEGFSVLMTDGRWTTGAPGTDPGPSGSYLIAEGQGRVTLRNDDGPAQGRETFSAGFDVGAGAGSVSGGYSCEDQTPPLEGCPEGSQPAFTINLERGGKLLGTGSGRRQVVIPEPPQAGDVLRFVVGGVARASVTFDGRPSLDASCTKVGRRTTTGRVSAGFDLTFAGPAQVARTGETFTVTFPRPLLSGEGIILSSRGDRVLSQFETLSVLSRVLSTVCGSGPPPCRAFQLDQSPGQSVSRLAYAAERAARSIRRAGIRKLLSGKLRPSVLACATGTIETRVIRYGSHGPVVLASGDRTLARPAHTTVGIALKPTAAGRRVLGPRRRATVWVVVRQIDSEGRALERRQRVTLDLSGRR